MAESPYVYGATCVWFGPISETRTLLSGIPVCPHCGSVLLQVDSEAEWWASAEKYEAEGHPDYTAMLRWVRIGGRHFRTMDQMQAAYKARG